MPDTGQFQIFTVASSPRTADAATQLQAVTLRCRRCGAVETLRSEHLIAVGAGTILTCPKCGNRQALSNAHVLDGHTR